MIRLSYFITFLFMEGSSQQVETQTDFQAVVGSVYHPFRGSGSGY